MCGSEVSFYWSICTNKLNISEGQSEAVGRRTDNTMAPRKGTEQTISHKTIHRIPKILELANIYITTSIKIIGLNLTWYESVSYM